MSEEQQKTQSQSIIYAIAPLLLLLLCLGLINILPRLSRSSESRLTNPVATILPTLIQTETAVLSLSTPPIPTVTASPQVTLTPLPTLPPGATIKLLGPPQNAVFNKSDAIALYWHWPYQLDDAQQFVVVLIQDGQEFMVGTLAEPNVGNSYRLHASINEQIDPTSPIEWQVRLETVNSHHNLIVSQKRPFSILSNLP